MKIKNLLVKKILPISACIAIAGLSTYSSIKYLKDKEKNLKYLDVSDNKKLAEFVLDSNRTTGYSWHYKIDNPIIEISSYYKENRSFTNEGIPVDGIGGVEYITFTPKKEGKAVVTLWYSNNEDKFENTSNYLFTVDKDLNISWEHIYEKTR